MTALVAHAFPAGAVDGDLVCRAVHQVTHDVKSFVLEVPGPVSFVPGQYLTVTVDAAGQQLSRCYSISSPSTRPHALTITVKRVPGGPVSEWLHDHVRLGERLTVSGPYGEFISQSHPADRLLFLSAGSGITPLMSMARTLVDEQSRADVVFVHHARTPADIVFRRELEQLPSQHPGIRVAVVCETDADDEEWRGPRGRIDAVQLRTVAPDVAEREVFVCGPAPYRAVVRRLLLDAGVDPARVHEESYVLGETSAPVRLPQPSRSTYAIELRRSGVSVECDADTTILDAVEQAGITLPASCREGVCGTCKTQLLSGAVDMDHQGGIRPREVERDLVLLCCSVPTSDLVLEA